MCSLTGEESLMRSDDDVRHHQKECQLIIIYHLVRPVFIEELGFFLINIQTGTANLMTSKSFYQILGLDKFSSTGIDEHHPFLHFGDGITVDDLFGLISQRTMQRDDITLRIEFVQRNHLDLIAFSKLCIRI